MMDRLCRRYGFGLMLIAMAMFVSACGSSGGGGGDAAVSNNMPENQALAFAQSITRVSTESMAAPAFKGAMAADAVQLRASYPINQQIAYTLNCTAGGTMKASGSITGSVTDTGSGYISLNVPITISDWKCEPPSTINGDPYISITGTFTFLNGAPATQQHISVSGGFKSESWSCSILLGTDFNTSGGGHTSGTICGYTVDFTF